MVFSFCFKFINPLEVSVVAYKCSMTLTLSHFVKKNEWKSLTILLRGLYFDNFMSSLTLFWQFYVFNNFRLLNSWPLASGVLNCCQMTEIWNRVCTCRLYHSISQVSKVQFMETDYYPIEINSNLNFTQNWYGKFSKKIHIVLIVKKQIF